MISSTFLVIGQPERGAFLTNFQIENA